MGVGWGEETDINSTGRMGRNGKEERCKETG